MRGGSASGVAPPCRPAHNRGSWGCSAPRVGVRGGSRNSDSPRHKAAEFFGFFAIFEKFAGILGPAIFGLTAALEAT